MGSSWPGSTAFAGAMVVDDGTVVDVLAAPGSAVFNVVLVLEARVLVDVAPDVEDVESLTVEDEPAVVVGDVGSVESDAVVDDVDVAVLVATVVAVVDDAPVVDEADVGVVSFPAVAPSSVANAGAAAIIAVATIDSKTVLRDIPN